MNIEEYYQNGRYSKKFILLREALSHIKGEMFVAILRQRNIKRVLDIGCGDGVLGVYLREKIGAETYGIDISEKGVKIANRRGLVAKVGDAQKEIPFQAGFFDAVIANEIIEHLYNPDSFLKEVKKVLRKGGLFIIGTPNMSFWFNRFLFIFGVYPLYLEASTEFRKIGVGFLRGYVDDQPVGHVRVFNAAAIRDLLQVHGFKIVAMKGMGVPFSSSNRFASFIYKMIDSFFSLFPALASDLVVVASKL